MGNFDIDLVATLHYIFTMGDANHFLENIADLMAIIRV